MRKLLKLAMARAAFAGARKFARGPRPSPARSTATPPTARPTAAPGRTAESPGGMRP